MTVLALLAACGVTAQGEPKELDRASLPRALTSVQPTPQTSGPATVRVYLVRDTHLVTVQRAADQQPTVTGLMMLLNAGPTAEESARGLRSNVPTDVSVSVVITDGIARVTVPEQSRTDEILGFGQIVLTLFQSAAVRGVVFVRDDAVLTVPKAGGAISNGPFTSADFDSLVTPA
jgi:hypothetical protein